MNINELITRDLYNKINETGPYLLLAVEDELIKGCIQVIEDKVQGYSEIYSKDRLSEKIVGVMFSAYFSWDNLDTFLSDAEEAELKVKYKEFANQLINQVCMQLLFKNQYFKSKDQ